MQFRYILSLLLAAILMLLVGCMPNFCQVDNKIISLTDSKGNVVQIPDKPQRIVSLTLGTDEILLDLVEPERIAALTYLADDPGISHVVQRSGRVANKLRRNTVEAILALKPDLVLIADWWGLEILDTLRDMKIPVYVYKTPYSISEVRSSVREVAKVVGEEAKGEKIINEFDAKLECIKQQTALVPQSARKQTLAVTSHGALGGKGSMYDDMCKYAGVGNCLSYIEMKGMQTLSKEEIVRLNPEAIVVTNWTAPGMTESAARKDLLNDPALQTVKAVQLQDIIEVPGSCVYCISQYVVDGIGVLAAGAYPDYIKIEGE